MYAVLCETNRLPACAALCYFHQSEARQCEFILFGPKYETQRADNKVNLPLVNEDGFSDSSFMIGVYRNNKINKIV